MRLLLVEDYAPLRKALTRGLVEAGYAVDATGDGEEGLWYARSGDHDVLVLDIMLPGLDGLSILDAIREKGADAAVLLLTAKDAVESRVEGLDRGADDYLVKPFAFEELLARIRALVRRKYDRKDPVLRVADLQLDTVARRARRSDRPIELTATEYSILELLVLRTGAVVTRDDILTHIYEFDGEAQSNVVDVYIGYLRRKLETDGAPRLIHTRRGQGYILEERIS